MNLKLLRKNILFFLIFSFGISVQEAISMPENTEQAVPIEEKAILSEYMRVDGLENWSYNYDISDCPDESNFWSRFMIVDSIPDSVYTVTIRATNINGLKSGEVFVRFNLDKTKPEIPIPSHGNREILSRQVIIKGNVHDVNRVESLEYSFDGTNHPFIAYKGVNRSGKVAWLTGTPADGADSNEQYTGSWEIMILPTQITNTDSNKFCIGVDTNGLPVVGYTNGGIEYIRLLADLQD